MDEDLQNLFVQLNTILIGKEEKIKVIIANLLAGGNILLEDMPGVGKTSIAKALARSIGSETKNRPVKFMRVQATPDLLPYDITGIDVFDVSKNKFVFKPGPIFTDILLADELNRTTPKVQSALLQAMAEKCVTIGRRTYKLSQIFFVIATQNPVESEGTYPLPAAQLDRFSSCISLGYPDINHELIILNKGKSEERLKDIKVVITDKKLLTLQSEIFKIEVNEKLKKAIVNICNKTRILNDIRLGLSTRSALLMVDLLKAFAYLNGRDYADDQDLKELAIDVWSHRLILFNPQIKKDEMILNITIDEIKKIY